MSKRAVLFLNIGSPKANTSEEVGKYLKEFLMDKYIISIPFPFRWILVNFFIVPKRKFASALKYQKIWKDGEAPLILITRKFIKKLQLLSRKNIRIDFAMRYGAYNIPSTLENMKRDGVSEITLVPQYPQYAEATTRSSIEAVESALSKLNWSPKLNTVEAFYKEDFFIKNYARLIAAQKPEGFDHILFSFHGLPARQLQKNKSCLLSNKCCMQIDENNKNCYRAQCFETARRIAKELSLQKEKWSISFQSRLGPTKWIQPYTDKIVQELCLNGVGSLLVVCPSFVTDCLETLEEIGIGLEEDFFKAGGRKFQLVSCLNDEDSWIKNWCELLDLNQ